ncbi:tyrosine-protein phosphatase non-receptor type 22 [Mugil cephalus]|uniref:tyrosine-protein phosphatase non-receptor type 22 n=1 Tax=Mugil cephalus TaxID=48193 RepID=UPI001FB81BDC|nr:tyrosine-protein phosphatase non-receptor type 22 [Mugil cephalus]
MEQQAWILRSFLDQQERLEAVDQEATNAIAGEFGRLKSQSIKYRTDKTYTTKAAEKQENIKKNRYKDIVPFDHSRVKLSLATSKNSTDYINANFIKGVTGSRAYIATQGPLPHTVLDFLRMIWEYNIEVVVMACREFEMGKKKCEVYWPQNQEETFVCEPFTVYCDSEESKGDYLTRTLRMTYRNCSRTLKQLHYVNWPDHGVPDTIPPILDMLHEMRSYQDHDDIPICIHCSAGCGRTGALCAIDYTWNLLRRQMITSDFRIYDLVQNMRTQRPSVVQTKEQYELVYRTIKFLFQRYLQTMDTQTCQNEVVPSALNESEFSYLTEDYDLMQQFQHLLEEERQALPQYYTALPSAPNASLIDLRAEAMQWDQQQWQLIQTLPEATRAPAVEEKIQESKDVPSASLPPSSGVAAAVCMMVEDPYFDTPISSPSSGAASVDHVEESDAWTFSPIFTAPTLCLNDLVLEPASDAVAVGGDEDAPPPLPERTPESYVLDVNAALSDPNERLIIPPNAAAEPVRELGGSPPSPVPPLPERTPESYELAVDEAAVEQRSNVTPSVRQHKIGMSSEWSGNSLVAANPLPNGSKDFVRSKSLKVKMTFTAAAPDTHLDLASNATPDLRPYCPPLDPHPPQIEDSLEPPLPDRTPESFIIPTEETTTRNLSARVGMSSEWDGTAQPKTFLDGVMNRSKSVRAKSTRQEPLTALQPHAPPPVVVAGGGSVERLDVNHRAPLNADKSGNKLDKSTEKSMSRTKSLKFFKHKQKPKTPPPPPPTQPGAPAPSHSALSSMFKFGFGQRFAKPKGPRSYPETWV